jgi:ABC-type antimicrobial peptide transport system permease subunit
MYEAFFTVVAATMCGVLIGILTSTLVTAQFYLFLELPLVVQVPWALTGTVIGVSFSTTYFAVLIPISDVNKRRIASVLKSGS